MSLSTLQIQRGMKVNKKIKYSTALKELAMHKTCDTTLNKLAPLKGIIMLSSTARNSLTF